MSTNWVIFAYCGAGLLALLFLYLAGARRWYWHILSVIAALVIGLIPTPPSLNSPKGSMLVGVIFSFLLLWGIAAPLFRKRRAH
jgi:hypothetical protein